EVATSEETRHGQRREDERGAPERDRDQAPACAGGAPEGPTCARCHRPGVVGIFDLGDDDARTSRERRSSRRGGRAWPMSATMETVKPCPVATMGTTLSRARCRQPAKIERMKQSLTAHGQLTPVVAVAAPEGIELIDGFKRHAAARMLGLSTLVVSI